MQSGSVGRETFYAVKFCPVFRHTIYRLATHRRRRRRRRSCVIKRNLGEWLYLYVHILDGFLGVSDTGKLNIIML